MMSSFAAFIYGVASFMLGRLLNVEKWYDKGFREGYQRAVMEAEMEILHG